MSYLNPAAIYSDYKNGKINKISASNYLIPFIKTPHEYRFIKELQERQVFDKNKKASNGAFIATS